MPWNSGSGGGFNNGAKPWLPLYPQYKEINAKSDIAGEKSVFRYFKNIIALRKEHPVLRYGIFEDLTGDAKTHFLYRRRYGDEEMIVLCNYGAPTEISLPKGCVQILGNYPEHQNNLFAPYEAAIYRIEK